MILCVKCYWLAAFSKWLTKCLKIHSAWNQIKLNLWRILLKVLFVSAFITQKCESRAVADLYCESAKSL